MNQSTKNIGTTYNQSFWTQMSSNIVDSQKKSLTSLIKLQSRPEAFREGIFLLKAHKTGAENSSNHLHLNCVSEVMDLNELTQFANASLEMALYIQNILFQHLDTMHTIGASNQAQKL